MRVLVAYASRHGATQGIAERIAETLRAAGIDAKAQPVASVKSVAGYDAFVIGSAAYLFHWLKPIGFAERRVVDAGGQEHASQGRLQRLAGDRTLGWRDCSRPAEGLGTRRVRTWTGLLMPATGA